MEQTFIKEPETDPSAYNHIWLNTPVPHPITEVKELQARLVLGWVTAWEYRVL